MREGGLDSGMHLQVGNPRHEGSIRVCARRLETRATRWGSESQDSEKTWAVKR